jgi:hypothetical protein
MISLIPFLAMTLAVNRFTGYPASMDSETGLIQITQGDMHL